MKKILALMMLVASVAWATPTTTINIPNNFTPNTTIQSAQVNSDFTECQNQYNAHTHNDITSVGAITSGSWLGTPVGTTYGGTGQNFGGSAQGSIIYFNGAGTTATLAPSTAGSVLTTQGAGANPTWTAGGSARNAITSGFEASASVGNLDIRVYGGSLFHNNTGVEVATTTILTLATAGDWSSGSTVSYGGGAGWNYIGVTNLASNTNKGVYFLGDLPPHYSDVNGNSSGTSLYSYDGTRYYRVIGAVRIATTNRVAISQMQSKDRIMLGEPVSVANAVSAGVWSAATPCSAGMPRISNMAIFGLESVENGGGTQGLVSIRPNGSIWSTDVENGISAGSSAGVSYTVGGQRICATDDSQQIQYYNDAGEDATQIDVEGYYLSIR